MKKLLCLLLALCFLCTGTVLAESPAARVDDIRKPAAAVESGQP